MKTRLVRILDYSQKNENTAVAEDKDPNNTKKRLVVNKKEGNKH